MRAESHPRVQIKLPVHLINLPNTKPLTTNMHVDCITFGVAPSAAYAPSTRNKNVLALLGVVKNTKKKTYWNHVLTNPSMS